MQGSNMSSAIFLVLMAGILISKGQSTDQEFRSYDRHTIYVPKGTNYFLNVSSDMIPLTKTTCVYYEVHAFILKNSKEGNVYPSRIAVIPQQELKAVQSISGVITKDTQQRYGLGNVSLQGTVNNKSTSHDKFELQLKLKIDIPAAATNHPLFNEIEMVVRCVNRSDDVSSLGTRYEAGHYRLEYYNETNEGPTLNSTGITQASQSLSPDPGSSEEKKSPPDEGPTLNSTGITQASQSPSPDPGSSEEKKNSPDTKRKTDGSLILYFVLVAVFLSLVRWLTIILSSIYWRSRKVSTPGELV